MQKWKAMWLRKMQRSRQKARNEEGQTSKDQDNDSMDGEGQKYLDHVRRKLDRLVEDFTRGRLNSAQFEELYAHYQNERKTVERLITARPNSNIWRMAVTDGQSINIRRRLAARVVGYAVSANRSRRLLRVYGEFTSLQQKWVPTSPPA